LAPQPSLGLGLLLKIRLNILEASQQFTFLQVRVVSPTLNPHPGGHIPGQNSKRLTLEQKPNYLLLYQFALHLKKLEFGYHYATQ
jgi:hypothetical protein